MEFYLEEIGDTPQAIFTGVDSPLNVLLGRFLNSAPYFVPDILYEISLVERRVVASSGFESEYVDVQVFHDRIEIKARPNALAKGAAEGFTLPLTEAKLLLMEWGRHWNGGGPSARSESEQVMRPMRVEAFDVGENMPERMSAEKRREQLLRVMKEVFAEARTQGEFTAQKVAHAGGVVVLLYRSVGKEFKELRAQLTGPRFDDVTLLNKLKGQIKELRRRVRELEGQLKAKMAEVIRVIELIDEENRMLRSESRLLRQRLAESEVAIIPIPNAEYRIKRRHFSSPSTTLIDELRQKLS